MGELISTPARGTVRRILPFIAACLALLGLEAWIFLYQSDDWDLHNYQSNADTLREAGSLRAMYDQDTVEYPPLAVVMVLATDAVAQHLGDCSALLGRTFDPYDADPSFVKFQFLYRFEMAVVIFATFLLLWRVVNASAPHESPWARAMRFAVFGAGLALLSTLAFDRLDVVMGAMLLVALLLMLGARHYVWSFLLLAAAVAFKFVPLILVPLWVIGSLPAELSGARHAPGGWKRLLAAVTGRGMVMAAFIVAFHLPFLLLGGGGSLAFLTYHKQRGIEFGSDYAALLGILKYTAGLKISAPLSYGSHDIVSALSPALKRLAPLIMLFLLGAASCLLVENAFRAPAPAPCDRAQSRFGNANGGVFILHALLLLFIFFFANKVFSPQYLFWVLPLVPLAPLRGWRRNLFLAAFVAVCGLTCLIYPVCVDDTLGAKLPTAPDVDIYTGPTPFGVLLLASRALLLAGIIAGLALHLLRDGSKKLTPPA